MSLYIEEEGAAYKQQCDGNVLTCWTNKPVHCQVEFKGFIWGVNPNPYLMWVALNRGVSSSELVTLYYCTHVSCVFWLMNDQWYYYIIVADGFYKSVTLMFDYTIDYACPPADSVSQVRVKSNHLPAGASTLRTGLLRASTQWLLPVIRPHVTRSETKTRCIII